jgi:hypothetical protein
MLVEAVAVRVLRPYVIEVTFQDGVRREIDLESELWGEVFEPLRDPALFTQAAVDPTFGSVFWPTGADLAPEFLYFGEEGPPPGYLHARDPLEDADPILTDAR